ncbi:MAG: hypothetical protein NPIRA02_02220 [Nitrospirales bacterium]|nr:MAG: hypothetical protein NPIRA02_02220 [Nitrospirales bacterium]
MNDLPVPNLEGRPLTKDEYYALTPEKLELLNGYLISDVDVEGLRKKLLLALFLNEGLLNVVKLVPREKWEEALRLLRDGER